MEKQLQALEDAERRAAHQALAVRRHSSHVGSGMGVGFSGMALPQPLAHGQAPHASSSHHHTPHQLPPLPPPPPHSSPFDFSMLHYPPPATAYSMLPQSTSQYQPHHPPPARSSSLPQTATVDSMSWNWPAHSGSSSTGPQHQPQFSASAADPMPSSSILPTMPWSLISSSNDVSTVSSLWPGANPDLTPQSEHEDLRPGSSATSQVALTPTFGVLNANITLGSGYPPPNPSSSGNAPPEPMPEPLADKGDDPFGANGLGLGLSNTQPFPGSTNNGFNLLGGWGGANGGGSGSSPMLDEKDISQSARDYLCVDPWLYLDAVYSAC